MAKVKRGDVFYAELDPVIGSEQGGVRPVLIIQNDVGNQHSPTTIVAALSSKIEQTEMPTHVCIKIDGLSRTSTVMLEQIRTIDKMRLKTYINSVGADILKQVDKALAISVGLKKSAEGF